MQSYDAIIAGGGIAGLTAAAFLCKSGRRVLLCEKEDKVGGLVGSFTIGGVTFDAGLRAMENSGVLFPMLKALELEVEFLPNEVSVGIADSIVRLSSEESLQAYAQLLKTSFPGDAADIDKLIAVIQKTMRYMDVLYGIDNPLFIDLKKDRSYVLKTLLPWLFRYVTTVGKIQKLNRPVKAYLRGMMQNQALIDSIAQHFFKATPAFFALSYFSLYLDYNYPKGGTGTLVRAMQQYILENGGAIRTGAEVQSVDPARQTLTIADGVQLPYEALIWAADRKALYRALTHTERLPAPVRRKVEAHQTEIADCAGGDSVLTLYLTANLDPSYFGELHSPHFFYTPDKTGLSALPPGDIQTADGTWTDDRAALLAWVKAYLRLTTYEISIPALRDESLAPPGQTGLVISTLMDYALVRHIEEMGLYEEYKRLCEETMLNTLTDSVYPALRGKALGGLVSTPLTLARRTGNTGGAITGWAFTNERIPAVSQMTQIKRSVQTPLSHLWQAGQWSYSPSGFPIAILTGKMAADAVLKHRR